MADNDKKRKKRKMPVIKCECGAEFLLLPDLAEMSKVVRDHALLHEEAVEDQFEAEKEYSRIEESLIVQILRKAAELG